MTYFSYDGTFTGLLAAIFEVYERKTYEANIINKKLLSPLIFDEIVDVVNDNEKSKRVYNGLKDKLSQQGMKKFYFTFLSELPLVENLLLKFAQTVFASKTSVEQDFGNPTILEITKIAKRVHREKHRFEAFVRFENIGNQLFFANINPDFNVLPILIPHFKNRYSSQDWVIYDTKRNYGVNYNSTNQEINEVLIQPCSIKSDAIAVNIDLDPEEKLFQALWKNYFKNTNIESRKNTKLHIQHVPKRYWKYLPEKQI
ncbi:MAG: DNA metabolism protein [Cytophagales bacterium]|nr:MAG: DNA metabolism protein [Cytophagales bacterium]